MVLRFLSYVIGKKKLMKRVLSNQNGDAVCSTNQVQTKHDRHLAHATFPALAVDDVSGGFSRPFHRLRLSSSDWFIALASPNNDNKNTDWMLYKSGFIFVKNVLFPLLSALQIKFAL